MQQEGDDDKAMPESEEGMAWANLYSVSDASGADFYGYVHDSKSDAEKVITDNMNFLCTIKIKRPKGC